MLHFFGDDANWHHPLNMHVYKCIKTISMWVAAWCETLMHKYHGIIDLWNLDKRLILFRNFVTYGMSK